MNTKIVRAVAAAAALACASATAWAADQVKIGMLTTLSGPGAALGIDIRDGFELAVKQLDGKLGDLDAKVIVVDDQLNPDAAKQAADRMIKRDKVDFMTGIVFSNVMLAVGQPVFDSKTFYISANSGPSQYAGEQCNPYFFSASYQNDQLDEAAGQLVTDQGYKKVALIAPNYPAGRDHLNGFKRLYQGDIVLEEYTQLKQLDYGAELSKLRASGADAVYIFLPGGLGINFIKQFTGAGLDQDMKLFAPGFSADEDVIPAVGEPMLGILNTSQWAHDMDNEANRRFVAGFEKEYGRLPSMYASQGYDAAMLMDGAIRKVGGNLDDKDAMRAALESAPFEAVQGNFKFDVNHYPIQDFYVREIVKDDQGRVTNKLVGKVLENHRDAYVDQCKMPS